MKLSALILLALILISCSKDSIVKDDNATLIGSAWKLTASRSDKAYDWDGNGTLETDIYATKTNCDKDYRMRFNTTTLGELWKNCSDPVIPFQYGLYNNGYGVLMAIQIGNMIIDTGFDIAYLNSTTLVTTYVTSGNDGANYLITDTYTKQ